MRNKRQKHTFVVDYATYFSFGMDFMKRWFSLAVTWLCGLAKHVYNYFNDGTFVVQFYPFLLHPCIRNSYFSLIKLVGILLSFCGVFYLVSEFVVILFTDITLSAYEQYSTLELLQSGKVVFDEQEENVISPLFYALQGAYWLQAVSFLPLYALGLSFISDKKLHCLGLFSALLFSLGCALIAGQPSHNLGEFGGLNNGFALTLFCGHLSLLFCAFTLQPWVKAFQYQSIFLGLSGCILVAVAYFYPNPYLVLLERGAIYCLILWEILAGFAILKPLVGVEEEDEDDDDSDELAHETQSP